MKSIEEPLEARNNDFFRQTLLDFKERAKNMPHYSQLKFFASKDIPLLLKGILPGKRKKWIQYQNGTWTIHDKFLVLFEAPEFKNIIKHLIQLIPEEIRPREDQLLELSSQSQRKKVKLSKKIDQMVTSHQNDKGLIKMSNSQSDSEKQSKSQGLNKQKKVHKLLPITEINTNHLNGQSQKQLPAQEKKRPKRRLDQACQTLLNEFVPSNQNEEDGRIVLRLLEDWFGDVLLVLQSLRQQTLSYSSIRNIGLHQSIVQVRKRQSKEHEEKIDIKHEE